ncbi:MAG: pyrroline-5-carboxylate reductase dimerization domain-containing protein [Solirubrobacteraceae bacterium]
MGLIGAGNMARALARGWGDPVLCADAGSGRARSLADELGGEALASAATVAERADLVVLCHKPAQLGAVAAQLAGRVKAIASVLGATPIAALQGAYPDVPVFRLMPNTPVEVRKGVICYAAAAGVDPQLEQQVLALFERVGTVVQVAETLIDVAMAVMSVGPAYQAMVAEAQVDAAVRHGVNAALAGRLVTETMSGTAALLTVREYDTLAVRREVTSPGGSTARGLAALERAGLRAAFQDAIDAAAGWSSR